MGPIDDFNKMVFTYLNLLLLIFTGYVSPGANDLHFHDGASTADVIAGDVFFEILDPPELRYSYRIRPALDFGAPFNGSQHFEKIRLVPTVPFHSCTDILNSEEIAGQIAMSERGECSFVFKTAMAQQAGARALIITESVDKWDESLDHLIEMVDDKMNLNVNIPAAFLLGRSGATILRTLRKLHKPYAIINLPINLTYVPISKMNQPPWIAWIAVRAGSAAAAAENLKRRKYGGLVGDFLENPGTVESGYPPPLPRPRNKFGRGVPRSDGW